MHLSLWISPISAALGSLFAIILLRRLAPAMGMMDVPGGRKDHDAPTPVIGGVAMFGAVAGTLLLFRVDSSMTILFVSAAIVMLAGLMDDLHEMSQWPRFLVQLLACILVIWLAGLQLKSVGNLMGWGAIGMSIFAIPATIFAVVGVINAINMCDGLDGAAGLQCLIAVCAYALVAHLSGLGNQTILLLAWAGALVAFLAFNLRTPWRKRAAVFMGDAGSMTLGFLLGWMAVDLTHGSGRTFPPICALWVVVIPLCDTVSLMLRRRAEGRSPFQPDRQHLHHQILARGYSVGQTAMILAAANLFCAGIGVGGWLLGIPEPVLFAAFVATFVTHHLTSKRFWRKVVAAEAGKAEPLPSGQH